VLAAVVGGIIYYKKNQGQGMGGFLPFRSSQAITAIHPDDDDDDGIN